MITISGKIAAASGLDGNDRMLVHELVEAWRKHYKRNELRHTYYVMHNMLKDLGISVPPELQNLETACGWGKKCVDVMVEHSKFDGFTCEDETTKNTLARIVRRTRMRNLYRCATTSALEQCFALYFVTKDDEGRACVTAYPASVCGCTYDDATRSLESAMFVVSMHDNKRSGVREPDWVNVVTKEHIIRIKLGDNGVWHAAYEKHGLGHLPVFLAAHESSLNRPFGMSRITREVMGHIDSAVRANVNEEIAAAFAVSTQKYILGTDGDPFEDLPRWKAYIGSIINIDANEEGEIPKFGQLQQPSMEPLETHWRLLCGKMSAATGIHVSQFGLVHDNPSSKEAIDEENKPLIKKVSNWNDDVSDTLVDVATALLATEQRTTFDEIEGMDLDIKAHFLNPAMPTLAQQTDSSVKIASVVPNFVKTTTFWSMNGFSQEESIQVMREVEAATKDAETREATNAALTAMFGGSKTTTTE